MNKNITYVVQNYENGRNLSYNNEESAENNLRIVKATYDYHEIKR